MKPIRTWAALLVVGLLWATLAAWALSSPIYSSPDDNYHLPMLYCQDGRMECIEEGKRPDVCYAFKTAEPAVCADYSASTNPPNVGIRSGWYPPLYYEVASGFVQGSLAETTVIIRWLNAGFAVALMAGSLVFTRRSLRPAVLMSWLVTSVPYATFLFASINPHAWTIAGLAALWGPLLSFVLTASKANDWRAALWPSKHPWRQVGQLAFVELCAIAALGSRSESSVFLAIITVTLGLFALRWPLTRTTRGGLAALGVLGVLVVQAAVAYLLVVPGRSSLEAPEAASAVFSGWEVLVATFQLPLSAVTSPALGWLDTPMAPLTQALCAGAFLGALLLGLRVLFPVKRLALAVFAVMTFGLVLYLLANASSAYRYQPRYFLPLLFVLAGLTLLPALTRRSRRGPLATPAQWIAIGVAVVIVNCTALLSNSVRYVIGLPNTSRADAVALANAEDPVWWWGSVPFSPFEVWIIGSVCFAAAIGIVLAWVVRSAKAPASAEPADAAPDAVPAPPVQAPPAAARRTESAR